MYELVPFVQKINGTTIQKQGVAVGDYLIISWAQAIRIAAYNSIPEENKRYRIFNVLSGKPVIPNQFTEFDDALAVAKYISDTYGDYLLLAQEYPRMDIIGVSRWSVPNGVQYHLALSALKDKDTINLTDITEQLALAESEAKQMTGWMDAYS